MDHKQKTDQWTPDEWLQAAARGHEYDQQCECKSTKQRETRHWNRSVFVPDGMQPLDIIKAYPFKISLPPFHAGQMGINKHDVECIASAMADPNLRWRKMCHFTIAYCDDTRSDYAGHNVLITGHHRFLAFLLCGVPPLDLPPVHIRMAPLDLPYVFPWTTVEWGK